MSEEIESVADEVVVRGAREHNLKGVDLRFPRDSLVVFTGLSGSGKSSLAYDTIFKEGQRRYLESLSAYARQFLGGMEKPKVEGIEGLSPTVAITQKSIARNPRSTVGTVTEIWDFLRLAFARLGVPHCPDCGREVAALAAEEIAARVLAEGRPGEPAVVLAPVVVGRKGSYRKELAEWRRKGWVRARIDGRMLRLDEEIHLHRYKKHDIELVVDRLRLGPERRGRLLEAVEQALETSGGLVAVLRPEAGAGPALSLYSGRAACPAGHGSIPELEPVLFSFNSPKGACPACEGLGEETNFDAALLLGDPEAPPAEGGVLCFNKEGYVHYTRVHADEIDQIVRRFGGRMDRPLASWPEAARKVLFHGAGERVFATTYRYQGRHGPVERRTRRPFPGLLGLLADVWEEWRPKSLRRFQRVRPCRACGGARLRPEALAVTLAGRGPAELAAETLAGLRTWAQQAAARFAAEGGRAAAVARELFRELDERLAFLVKVGLGYLRLDRAAATLSGGEAQRIRLAAQVGSGLRGVLYVLDEPSIGLHARDNARLLETLRALRDRGNTVCVVEHDEETMRAADWLVDVGPGAGVHGGRIVAAGPPDRVLAHPDSLTARYLRGERPIPVPERRGPAARRLELRGARLHNLKDLDVDLPLERFVCVSGVSGSGKSSLVHGVLRPALEAAFRRGRDQSRGPNWRRLRGASQLDRVVEIDQSPIGRTPRSNPATYTGLWTHVRDLFASLPESRVRGYVKGRFSFNLAGGRCAACEGAGVRILEMQFLEPVEVVCESCGGRRFNAETLEIRYRGRNIHDVLEMTVEEAARFFEHHPKIRRILDVLERVGLGYLKLGQSSTTLSGGEAQRIKLAARLAAGGRGRTLYVLDEPTTGLHFEDIRKLLGALQELVDRGDSVLVIEHQLDVLKCADWILDLGPDGGEEGGRLVCAGPPEVVAACRASHTGKALRPLLGRRRAPRRRARAARRRRRPADLVVRGARLHNLAGAGARIPARSFTVVTGVSGSGKSSLAFDTIFQEGRRRFLESLSTYARRFLGRVERAPVDSIDGLLPAIAIDQRSAGRNPRSTVGTATEVLDHLRLLYARAGRPHCPEHGTVLERLGPSGLAARWSERFAGRRGYVLAPVDLPRALEDEELLELARERLAEWREEGFARYATLTESGRVTAARLDEEPGPAALRRGFFLVADRIRFGPRTRARLAEALELAGRFGAGTVALCPEDAPPERASLDRSCPHCGFHLPLDLQPRFFSFNHVEGACPACEGLGRRPEVDLERLIADPDKPLFRGALRRGLPPALRFLLHGRRAVARRAEAMAQALGFDLAHTPWGALGPRERALVLDGAGARSFEVHWVRERAGRTKSYTATERWPGLRPLVEERLRRAGLGAPWFVERPCHECGGARLSRAARAVTLGGRNLPELTALTVSDLLAFCEGLRLPRAEARIAQPVLREIRARLSCLAALGLGYLTLDRSAGTLSGGEAQRIRLAGQLGSRLTGTLYVLDEPTIGLHPRDTEALLAQLLALRDAGNTVLAVEHDEGVIRRADWVVDLGPGAGRKGGRVLFQGPPARLAARARTPTGLWLAGRRALPQPPSRRPGRSRIRLEGVSVHNLEGLDVEIPTGALVAVTGVSGSGKSSLVLDALAPALRGEEGPWRLVRRAGISEVLVVDQEPIGQTPRSTAATYLGIWTPIRELFAKTPDARRLGFGPGRFSFNSGPGRCPECEGLGEIRVEMHFLADVWVPCGLCRGARYDARTLEVRWRGKTIAEVCRMEAAEAFEWFGAHRRIGRPLKLLLDVGLGYLELGAGVHVLSGGEAQRLKLAAELARSPRADRIYLLDEPTTGLHQEDVAKLLAVLQRLVDSGATVVVVEHHMGVVRAADWVIDLGPGAGAAGGRIVAQGPPEEVARSEGSPTAPFLAQALGEGPTPAPKLRSCRKLG